MYDSRIDFLISDRDDTLIPAQFQDANYDGEDVRLIDHPFTLSLFRMMNATSPHPVKILSKGQGAQREDNLKIYFDKPLTYGLNGSHEPDVPLNVEYFLSGLINLSNSKYPAVMNIIAEGLYMLLGSDKTANEANDIFQILKDTFLPIASSKLDSAKKAFLQTKKEVNIALAFTDVGQNFLAMDADEIEARFEESKQEIKTFAKSFFELNDEYDQELATEFKDITLPLCIKVDEAKNQFLKINFSIQAILSNPEYHASTGKNFAIISRLAKEGYAINPDNINPDLGVVSVEYVNFEETDLETIDQRNVVFLDDEPDSVLAAEIFGFTGIIAASNEIIKTKSSERRKDGVKENLNKHRQQLYEKMDAEQKQNFLEHYFDNDQVEAVIFLRSLDQELQLTEDQQIVWDAFTNLDRLVSNFTVPARNHEDYTSFASFLKEIATNVVTRVDFNKAIPKKGIGKWKQLNPTPEQTAWMQLAALDLQSPGVNDKIIEITKDIIDTMKSLVSNADLEKYNVVDFAIVSYEN